MVAMFILVILSQARIICQTSRCSLAAAEKADVEAGGLQTWDELYHSYLRYNGCDDGDIAEGYTDSVGRLLTHHWNTLSRTFPLFASDGGYYKFVLRHIDPGLGIEDLTEIRANAVHSCPTAGGEYCVQIRKAAEKALRYIRTLLPPNK